MGRGEEKEEETETLKEAGMFVQGQQSLGVPSVAPGLAWLP